MVTTQAEKQKKDFDHVFSTIMEISQDDNLVKSLHQQGCGSINDILSMTESHIMSLEYIDKKSGKTTPVLLFWKSKLCILKAWNVYLKDSYGDFEWADEMIVNINAFNFYQVNEYNPELPIKSIPTPESLLIRSCVFKSMFFSTCQVLLISKA